MLLKDPVAVSPLAHRHDSLETVPSGSVTDAVASVPPVNVAGSVTVPSSSRLLTEMVTAMVASTVVSSAPTASLPSCTVTFTE